MTKSELIRRLARDPQLTRGTAGLLVELIRGRLRGHAGARIARGVKKSGPGSYQLERRSALREGSRLFVGPGATFSLGPGAAIGARSVVNVVNGLQVGAGTQVSWQCQILDSDFHQIDVPELGARPVSMPIIIGEHVLIGTGSIILKGVTIGDNAVVAAGSVVTRSVESGVIVAGNPARPVAVTTGWR